MEIVYLALRVLLSLAAVLGLLWMVQRRLTRSGRMPGAAKPVNVVTRQAIAPKASVVVVDVDGQRFLLGVTEQSVTVLNAGAAPVPEEIETPSPRLKAAESAAAPKPTVERVSGGAAFARLLSDVSGSASRSSAAAPEDVAYLPQANGTPGPLGGSILSPNTWKRTAAAIRRVR